MENKLPLSQQRDKPPLYSSIQTVPPQENTLSQPPPGYYPNHPPPVTQNQSSQPSNYGTTHSTTIIVPHTTPVVFVGGCPACRVGRLEDDYTCLGIFCAIFFFPLGILCCLFLKNRRCSNCGAYFG